MLKFFVFILALLVGVPAQATFLGDPLGLVHGGTAATSAATALTNLGALAKAGDTMSGNLGLAGAGTSPSTVPYLDAARVLQSSVVTPTELGYLSGVTAGIQSQINAINPSAYLPKAGGTMTGGLGLDYAGASPSGVVVTDAARVLTTSSTVDLAELNYLDGVTAAIQTQLNAKASNGIQVTVVNSAASPYTVLASDEFIVCDSSSGNVNILLPAVAASGRGRVIDMKKIVAANTCTLTADTGGTPDTIDSDATKVSSTQWENYTIVSSPGADAWYIR